MTEDEKAWHIERSVADAWLEPDFMRWVMYHKWRRAMLWQTNES